MLNDFAKCALDNARQNSKINGIFSKEDDDYNPIANSSDYQSEDSKVDTKETINMGDGTDFMVMNGKYSIQQVDSKFPSAEFAPFRDAMLRMASISLGYGVNFISIGNDLSQSSYSSTRHGLLSEKASWQMLQQKIIENLVKPVFEAWLDINVFNGKLNISSSQIEDIKDSIQYMPRSWEGMDPNKDAQASKTKIESGLSSISEEIAKTGRAPEVVAQQIQEDKKRFKDVGDANE
ncbi:phage portal protein [Francisella sp. 19X1-34]|uniref:phage portal protein n=1 Tax=Francisella sp. 19X1-34 TaxID=3087177 RepID=UPI002E340563|nr:phage portal protein [Francisella sp. 19X1-34]MED7789671.1 phage portal protein [Francisella sp. 19X1-34]